MIPIIGICGRAGSGKSSLASHIQDKHAFQEMAFSDPLKRFCSEVYQFSNVQLYGDSEERNIVDDRGEDPAYWKECKQRFCNAAPVWVQSLVGTTNPKAHYSLFEKFLHLRTMPLSPRTVLQTLGTDWGRNEVDLGLWAHHLSKAVNKLAGPEGDGITPLSYSQLDGFTNEEFDFAHQGIVVYDTRFPNEFAELKKLGATMIRLDRPGVSEGEIYEHESERNVDLIPAEDFDVIICNDGTLKDLFNDVDLIINAKKDEGQG